MHDYTKLRYDGCENIEMTCFFIPTKQRNTKDNKKIVHQYINLEPEPLSCNIANIFFFIPTLI